MSEQVEKAREIIRLNELAIQLKSESYAMLLLAASMATDEAVQEATRKVEEFALIVREGKELMQAYEEEYGVI